jgi:hypothetical protein
MMMDKCKAVAAAAHVQQEQAQMALVEAKNGTDAAVAWLLDQQEQQAKAAAPTAWIQHGKNSNGGACSNAAAMPDTAGQQQEQQPGKRHPRSRAP